jgi:2-keto-4-pentenoate hydratase
MRDGAIQRAAALLADAFDGPRLAGLPAGIAPRDETDAYAIQDAVLALGPPSGIGGWKIAPPRQGQSPKCGLIVQSRFRASGAILDERMIAPAAEAEFAFKLSADLPPRPQPYDVDEVAAAIGSAHVVVEILDSRFVDRTTVAPLSALADTQSNRLVVVGEGRADWRAIDSANALPVMRVGQSVHAVQKPMPTTAQLLVALAWLADHAGRRGHGLRTGQIIITGARCGPTSLAAGVSVEAAIDGVGAVTATMPGQSI